MPVKEEGFCKNERLSSRKEIARLFEEGKSFYSYPYNVIWSESNLPMQYPVRLAVSVTKRGFKRAVDRNRIKRMTREAWRKNKQLLYGPLLKHNIAIVVMLIYTGKEIPATEVIERKMRELIANFSLNLHLSGSQ